MKPLSLPVRAEQVFTPSRTKVSPRKCIKNIVVGWALAQQRVVRGFLTRHVGPRPNLQINTPFLYILWGSVRSRSLFYCSQVVIGLVSLCWLSPANSFSWQDLWFTRDQQAQTLMNQGAFDQATDMFERDDWRATSAYRAEAYEKAASLYQSFNTEEAYYNQGNALAHMGKYKEAIGAYDKTLALNPKHQDALHNRKILEELLEKDKQNQDKQNQDKQNQDKQNQDKQNQDKQSQDKQNQDKQNQDKQNQDKQNQDKQNQDKQNQDKQNQDKQNQDKQNQDKQNQDKQNQDKQNQAQQSQQQDARERQQAKEQWLRLIPDDPGGLLREKFLRDHLRRERGWEQ